MDKYSQDYKYLYKRKCEENKVLEKALELACEGWYDVDYMCYVCPRCECQYESIIKCMSEHLIEQAKKEFGENK